MPPSSPDTPSKPPPEPGLDRKYFRFDLSTAIQGSTMMRASLSKKVSPLSPPPKNLQACPEHPPVLLMDRVHRPDWWDSSSPISTRSTNQMGVTSPKFGVRQSILTPRSPSAPSAAFTNRASGFIPTGGGVGGQPFHRQGARPPSALLSLKYLVFIPSTAVHAVIGGRFDSPTGSQSPSLLFESRSIGRRRPLTPRPPQ